MSTDLPILNISASSPQNYSPWINEIVAGFAEWVLKRNLPRAVTVPCNGLTVKIWESGTTVWVDNEWRPVIAGQILDPADDIPLLTFRGTVEAYGVTWPPPVLGEAQIHPGRQVFGLN